MDNEELIKLVDGAIISYEDDYQYTPGCPTCDYGSEYITTIRVELTTVDIRAEVNTEHSFTLTEGFMIKLLLHNYDKIKMMTEKQFVKWFRDKLENKCPNGSLSFYYYGDI